MERQVDDIQNEAAQLISELGEVITEIHKRT